MGSCLGSCASTPKDATSTASTSPTSSASSTSTASSLAVAAVASGCLWHWKRARATAAHAGHAHSIDVDIVADTEADVELISNPSERRQRWARVYRILKFNKRRRKCSQFLDKYWDQRQRQRQWQWQHSKPSYAKLQCDSIQADIQLQNLDVHKLLNAASTLSKETEMHSYMRITRSQASSSLDLEWEHEYSQLKPPEKCAQQLLKQQQLALQQQPPECTPPLLATQSGSYASLDQLTTATSAAHTHRRHLARTARQASLQRHGSFTARTSCCSSTQNSWSHISTPESLEWDIDAEQEQQQQLRLEDDNLDDETLKLLHQIELLKNHVLQETGDGLAMAHASYDSMMVDELSEGLQFRAMHFGTAAKELQAHFS